MKKKIFLVLLVAFIGIQFVRINKTNPEYKIENDLITITNPSDEVATILKSTCYDCHSSETKYPWYTNIAPFSWLIEDHIVEGREHFNFSNWGTYADKDKAKIAEESVEEIEEGEMPVAGYTYLHSDADLSKEQKEQLISFFESL